MEPDALDSKDAEFTDKKPLDGGSACFMPILVTQMGAAVGDFMLSRLTTMYLNKKSWLVTGSA